MAADPVALARDLIRCPSVTPAEGGAIAYLEKVLTGAGFKVGADPERGFDHGTFSMMKPIYPDAHVPVVQVSMRANMDPAGHIEAGRALAPLRDENILIIGSGQSYHNLRR